MGDSGLKCDPALSNNEGESFRCGFVLFSSFYNQNYWPQWLLSARDHCQPHANRDFAMHFVQMCYMLCIEVAVQWAHAGCGLQRQKKIYWQLWHLASKWNGKGKARGKLLRGICDPLALTNHQKYPLKHVWTERIKASLFLLLSLYKYIFFFFLKLKAVHIQTHRPARINTPISHPFPLPLSLPHKHMFTMRWHTHP